MILEKISNLHEDTTRHTKRSNIDSQERKHWRVQKKNNEHIIIKQADKGGATVIMDKQYYKERMLEISDRETYAHLKKTRTTK